MGERVRERERTVGNSDRTRGGRVYTEPTNFHLHLIVSFRICAIELEISSLFTADLKLVSIVITWDSAQVRYSDLNSKVDENFAGWIAVRDIKYSIIDIPFSH